MPASQRSLLWSQALTRAGPTVPTVRIKRTKRIIQVNLTRCGGRLMPGWTRWYWAADCRLRRQP